MPRTNFYFGRVRFKHQLRTLHDDFDEEMSREEMVRQQILGYVNWEGTVFEESGGDVEWVFGRVQEQDGLILGQFGKIYTDRPTTYDRDSGEFVEEGEESQIADYSMFLFVPSHNLIIFNQRQHIGYRQFQNAFAGGYDNFIGLEDSLSVGLLQDAQDIDQLLAGTEVKFIRFDLVPTNPTSDPEMRVLDDRIQNMEADSFQMSAEADGRINMDDDLMQAALSMSSAGYGNWEMEGDVDGRREHYRSTDRPASHETERPSTLGGLMDVSRELIQRASSLVRDNE